MVIKSLTITEDAYDALKSLKQADESFSEVILRVRQTATSPLDKFFGTLKGSEKDAQEWIENVKKNRMKIRTEINARTKKLQIIRSKS